ncbi:MAG TPA: hypothetical protein VMS12_07365, partial [Thermoanaerobaculia bacterium]|nr:hypothetical protein [Thermoanaerobaculia bacterium]
MSSEEFLFTAPAGTAITALVNFAFLYVALIYFASVALARRLGLPFQWRIAGLFYVLVLLFLFQPLTMNVVNVPADYTQRFWPWVSLGDPDPDTNTEINDVILQMVPWANQVRESWRDLDPPLWNSAAGGGYPLLANGQSGGLSIFRLLALPVDLGSSMTVEAAFKLLIALTFGFLYLRRRFGTGPSLVGAVSFGFSTFLVIWLHFPHTSVACLLPALFYAIDLMLERTSWRRFVFCTAVFSFLVLNGHPESAAHAVFAAMFYAGYWLLTAPVSGKWQRLLPVAAAGIAALAIAAPLILPLAEAIPFSQRYEWLEVKPHVLEHANAGVIVPFYQPGFYGSIREHNIWGPGIAEVLCGYAGILGFGAWFGLLFHTVRGRTWRDPGTFYLIASPLLLGIVMGWPVVAKAFQSLPLFSIAANARLRYVLCWLFAFMAAAILDRLAKGDRKPLLIAVLAGGVALFLTFLMNDFPHHPAKQHAVVTTIPRVLVLVSTLLAAFCASRFRRHALSVLLTVVVLDLWAFGYRWNPTLPAESLYPETPLITELLKHQELVEQREVEPFRLGGTGSAFFPNAAGIFGLEDIRAHDPMTNARTIGMLRVFAGYSSDNYFGLMGTYEHPFIDYANVRFLISSPSEDYSGERFQLVYSGEDGRIFENRKALPRFFAPRNVVIEPDDGARFRRILNNGDWRETAILESMTSRLDPAAYADVLKPVSPDQEVAGVRTLKGGRDKLWVYVNAPRWTLVASSQPYWPGWKIHRDGR